MPPSTSSPTSPWHLFYQNQMQIDGGKNDKFVAFADAGGLVMGHYNDERRQASAVEDRAAVHARRQFLHGRVRRLVPQSFLADLRLHAEISERRPEPGQGPDRRRGRRRRQAEARRQLAEIGDGRCAEIRPRRQRSRRTSTPSTRCSRPISRARTSRRRTAIPPFADPGERRRTLPPQTEQTIGDLLSAKGIGWAWYAGAWQATLDGTNGVAAADLPVSPSALQLFRRHGARHRGARRASAGRRASTASNSSRRSMPDACRR